MMDIGMLKDVLSAMGAELPTAREPTNVVAEFIDREISELMPADPEITDIFKGVYVDVANKDPNKVLGVLIRVHGAIGALVEELRGAAQDEEVEPDDAEGVE